MFDFKLPDLGEGVHEGQIVNVLVSAGDEIAEYQPMLEVETDKAAVEIPAPKAGRVAQVHVAAGQVVKVGQVLISIDETGGGLEPVATPAAAGDRETRDREAPLRAMPGNREAPLRAMPGNREAPPRAMPGDREAPPRAMPGDREAPLRGVPAAESSPPTVPAPASAGPVPAAPAVRKLARELRVELTQVPATGPGGRVLREDVERFARGERPTTAPKRHDTAPFAAPPSVGSELPDFSQYGPVRREAASQIRKTIARQMTRAWQNVPRVTHCDLADVTDLERNRKGFNAALKEGQAKLTMTALVVKVVAAALRDFPMLNASFDAAAEEIIYKEYYHVGIAVDTPRGLIVPVLRDADRKTLPQLAAELADLGERARAVKFEIAELRGATFTITNVGAVGGMFATPMVNFPETGILGLGRAALQAAVRDGQIVPRLMLPLSLSYDHRIVDGADAARFVTEVIRSLENPLRLISL